MGTNLYVQKKSGFTLIEILVVVAIIALLAAILFPVFGRARENARRASCMSNLKQIMLGVMMYTQDYDERLPILVSTDYPGSRVMPWFQRLVPYIKSSQLFQCPSDNNTTERLQDAVPSAQRFPVSYAANSYSTTGVGGSLNVAGRSLAEFEHPSTTVYLSDAGAQSAGASGIAFNADGSLKLEKPGCPLLSAPFSSGATGTDNNWCGPNPRHLGMTNVGFYDGHVKALKVEKWYWSTTGSKTPWMDTQLGGE